MKRRVFNCSKYSSVNRLELVGMRIEHGRLKSEDFDSKTQEIYFSTTNVAGRMMK
jgi:hypothetical protein